MNPTLVNGKIKKNIFWDVVWSAFWILLLVLLGLKFFVFQQVTVVGESMSPNYATGELLLVNKVDRDLKRGQVVAVYEDPKVAKNADYWTPFQNRIYLKRIIGLPGESIEMIGGKVIIYNTSHPTGTMLDEGYVAPTIKEREEASRYHYPKTLVQDKTYFVLGDNRTNSTDSRIKGAFPEYAIFGQESLRFWPAPKVGIFDRPEYKYLDIDETTKTQLSEANANQPTLKYETVVN
jgi:signal peptidase I